MKYDPQRHHRRSIRLKGYDYSQAGAYFVTICAQDGQSLFGEVADGEMILNPAGEMVADIWQAIPEKFPTALLDAFVVMPNHIHFVIFLTNEPLSAESDPNTTVGVDPRVHPAPRPTPTSAGQTAAQKGETPTSEHDPQSAVGVDPRVHPTARPTATSGGQTAAQEGRPRPDEPDPQSTVGVDPRIHPTPRPTPTSGGQTAAQEGETPMAEDPAGQTRGQTWGSGQTTELGQTGGQTRGSAPTIDANVAGQGRDGGEIAAVERPALPQIVQWFKSLTTARYRHGVRDQGWPSFPGRVWQRNYYEHIIRNEQSLDKIRAYIHGNPAAWMWDQLHPEAPQNPFNASWNRNRDERKEEQVYRD